MTQMIRSARQFGSLIHNARMQRNLTQQGLADLVGTGQKTISRVENGHEGTKLETIFSLIAALDLAEGNYNEPFLRQAAEPHAETAAVLKELMAANPPPAELSNATAAR